MSENPNVIEVASLIGEASRVSMLMSLLGGRSLPASELAHVAGISPQTASSHLAKMVDGGLLTIQSNGRHRYYCLASPDVAHALEALITIAPPRKVRSLRESDQLKALRYARTCYDHLAGYLGVSLTDRLLELGYVEPMQREYAVTDHGVVNLLSFGIDIQSMKQTRRVFARQCLDWSERRHHISGILGASLANRFFELEWVKRMPNIRAIRLTADGVKGIMNEFGIELK